MKNWYMWDERPLTKLDKLRLLLGWKMFVRFTSPTGQCDATCSLSHQITRSREDVSWPPQT
jgi:hypothetical protein